MLVAVVGSHSLDYSTDSMVASWIFNEWPPVIVKGKEGGMDASRETDESMINDPEDSPAKFNALSLAAASIHTHTRQAPHTFPAWNPTGPQSGQTVCSDFGHPITSNDDIS